jgi:hypothetical protein
VNILNRIKRIARRKRTPQTRRSSVVDRLNTFDPSKMDDPHNLWIANTSPFSPNNPINRWNRPGGR